MQIIYETENYLAINKPAGFEAIVKGGGNSKYCLTAKLRRKLQLKELMPVHRLDRDTTGCLLYAKGEEAKEKMADIFRRQDICKSYLGVCLGRAKNKQGVVKKRLSLWKAGRRPVNVATVGSGLAAKTCYQVICEFSGNLLKEAGTETKLSLILFSPKTGRTHQIRVHAAFLGLPLLGDDQYGKRRINKNFKAITGLSHQALHAWKIRFPDPWENKQVKVMAQVPDDLLKILNLWFPVWKDKLKKLKK